MMEFLTSLGRLENVLYTFPILLVLLIAALQVVGLGFEQMLGAVGVDVGVDADVDMDVDAGVDVDADPGFDASDLTIDHGVLVSSLGFFHLGKVPLGFIVQMLLAFFGLAGLVLHTAALPSLIPEFADWSLAVKLAASWPLAALMSLGVTKLATGVLARVAPASGERPTRLAALAGRVGTVVSATVDAEQGRAEIKDRRGEAHTVFVRLVEGEASLQKGDAVQLVAFEPSQNYFRAQGAPAGVR